MLLVLSKRTQTERELKKRSFICSVLKANDGCFSLDI